MDLLANETVLTILINIGLALAILLLGLRFVRFLKTYLVRFMDKRNVDALLATFLGNIVHMLLVMFVVIAALGQLGIETTSLIAVLGAAGLAIGLALQGSLSNFASGAMIVALRPFKVGDFIEAAGIAGVVEGIQIFSTQLRTGDNKAVIVPNAAITGGAITNYSTKDTRRIDMLFGIGYDDDLKKAKQILLALAAQDARILADPEPIVAVSELADSSVNFVVRPWVKTEDYWSVCFDFTEAVKLAFDAEGITIPYPQQDLHIHNA